MIRFPLKILLNFFVSQKIISERRTEYLFTGSIFMDAYNNASFYNYNTIIYGHNMRDGSMFARLKELSNEATLRQCPYFWILTPDADYLYKICSIHQASSGSDTFTVRFTDYEEYKLWQDKMLSLSAPAIGETLEYQDRWLRCPPAQRIPLSG